MLGTLEININHNLSEKDDLNMNLTSCRFIRLTAVSLIAGFSISCASVPKLIPDSEIVRLSVLVTPTAKETIPEKTRIVVADIRGRSDQEGRDHCADAVKDALMRRLIENANYDVLARDDLNWIYQEMENNWSGRFDTGTAAELGELLGASLFVVGRVGYCGPTTSSAPDRESPVQFSIFASLQIVDLATGRVVVSSAGDGHYVPASRGLGTLLNLPESLEQVEEAEADALETEEGFWKRAKNFFLKMFDWSKEHFKIENQRLASAGGTPEEQRKKIEEYEVFRAAEDLANSFADNFFARSVWQTVEMWHEEKWRHSAAVHLVKLGDCPEALELIESSAAEEIDRMNQVEMARYLHNYGVVLLCANQPERAVQKLRSAYRIGYNSTTLQMLGLARKMEEWALQTEEDVEPEIDLLMEKLPSNTPPTSSGEPD